MLPQVELNTDSNTPLYLQLYEKIKESILSGRLQSGDRLPPTRQLAGSLGLNRATVAAAYQMLGSEGLMEAHVGRGSFVAGSVREDAANLRWDQLLGGTSLPAPAPPAWAKTGEGISFSNSRPSEDLFPIDAFRLTCEEVLSSPQARRILQLGSPYGYAPLRSYLLDQARQAGLARPDDDVAVTSGCQQAIDLLRRVLIRPGDTVLLEDPVYAGLRQVFSLGGARLVGIPVGVGGLDAGYLERVLQQESARLLVLTPSFQNPTGTTLPRPDRETILALARARGVVVVENDIYGELRYQGAPAPTLKELDDAGHVILLRSFSKVAFPGLRVGWVTGPRPVIARLAEAKQWADLHSDQLSQALLLRFAQSGRLESHRRNMVAAGAERLEAALQACATHLPVGTRFSRPAGGMNIWLQLPEPLDAAELLPRAERENVTYMPGKYFSVSRTHAGCLRLCFAGLPPDKIRHGIATLGGIFSNELESARRIRTQDSAPAIV